MTFDIVQTVKDMIAAGRTVIVSNGGEITETAEDELKTVLAEIAKIAENVALYEVDNSQGYPAESGKILLEAHVLALDNVLMGLEEMTRATVDQAMEAMFEVLKDALGSAVDVLF